MSAVLAYDDGGPDVLVVTPAADAVTTRVLAALSFWMAVSLLLMGLLVLAGWGMGNEHLMSVLEGHASMKPNTAIGFMISGVALMVALTPWLAPTRTWLSTSVRQGLLLLLGGATLLIGLASLLEYVMHVNFGIDQLLFVDRVQVAAPGRMAMISAINFTLSGMTLMLLQRGRVARTLARVLAGVVLMGSFASVVGYLYGVPLLFGGAGDAGNISMAVHTGAGFMVLSLAMLFAERDSRVMAMLSADAPGSRLVRGLLPLVVLLPVLVGWGYLQLALRVGGAGLGMALLAVTLVAAGVAAVWLVAMFLNRAERQRVELASVRANSHAAIRRSEQELRLVTDHLPALLCYIDPQGRFLRVNKTYERWHGRAASEIVGHTIRELLGPAYWEATRAARETALGGETVAFEAAYPALSGERQVQVTYAPDRDEQGHVRGLACMVLDVDEQRKAETALRQSEKLAVVGRLASSIAHEINNPLEAVTNLLYLAAAESDGSQPVAEYVNLAQHELARVTEIVTQTLRFHRHSSAASEITLAGLLDQVLVLYQGRVAGSGVTVERGFADRSLVRCGEGEIRQVLANLVGNALDAMPRGGRLLLRTRRVCDWRSGREGVALLVADTGHGMPAAVRGRLYEPFQTTKGEKGSGLGLWVSKDIVDRHEGSLQVSSSSRAGASGTVFRLWLPLG